MLVLIVNDTKKVLEFVLEQPQEFFSKKMLMKMNIGNVKGFSNDLNFFR